MKKFYFILLFFVCLFGKAQIINFPDANLKAKLLSSSPSNEVARNLSNVSVKIDTNNNNEIEVNEALQIGWISITYSNISDLSGLENFSNLVSLNCGANQISSINLTPYPNLTHLFCTNNSIGNLNLSSNVNLTQLTCGFNPLTALDVSMLTNLRSLEFPNCNISFINLSNQSDLLSLNCPNNQLTSLNLSNSLNLRYLYCSNNLLNSLDLTNHNDLMRLYCQDNQITSLDLSSANIYLNQLACQNNLLTSINIKNGVISNWAILDFFNNPNLEFVCADEEDVAIVQQKIDNYGYSSTCHVNSYCSFTPGGTFYDITGTIKFDANNNGCDAGDINVPNLNLSISNGTTTGTLISDTTGDYYIPVQAGIYTVTPSLENPTYFTISPTNFVVDFPTDASPFLQNFCITANGVHSNVEVVVMQMTPAIPGFDAQYRVIYKNIGNQIENGEVTLKYFDDIFDFVSSSIVFDSQTFSGIESTLHWNYINLLPFETRTIDVVLNLNSPMETPAVNIGDVIGIHSEISTTNTDEDLLNNASSLRHVVVGSYDPNDKTCLEGETVDVATIGEYVHYVIRFENTGTYPAQNIVVKDSIDTAKFDVSTLVPLHGSHEFYTNIKDNKVEFIFENINLDFNDATNDGYVAFKIKTLPTLTVGETFTNDANIYFDYNYPITTNAFATTIQDVLSNQNFVFENEFVLYPNPTHDILNISIKNQIEIQSVEIYNIVGQIVIAVPNTTTSIDVSNIAIGTYLIKVNTEKGSAITKFLKE